jgi:hypothetical protein
MVRNLFKSRVNQVSLITDCILERCCSILNFLFAVENLSFFARVRRCDNASASAFPRTARTSSSSYWKWLHYRSPDWSEALKERSCGRWSARLLEAATSSRWVYQPSHRPLLRKQLLLPIHIVLCVFDIASLTCKHNTERYVGGVAIPRCYSPHSCLVAF